VRKGNHAYLKKDTFNFLCSAVYMMSVRLFLSCQLANPDMSMVVHACNPKKFSLWDFFLE